MATPSESRDLDRLHQLTLLGTIGMPEASRALTGLIGRQHARKQALHRTLQRDQQQRAA